MKDLVRQPRPQQLLTHILDTPELISAVRQLDHRTLGRLIHHVGIEDAGELIALATTEQLQHVLDDDLWGGQPGKEESFDPSRFVLWLEVMLEAGEAPAAQRLTELPEDLVALGLFENMLVLDLEAFSPRDVYTTEKALASAMTYDLDRYTLVSRAHEGWDSILTVLLALDRDHNDYLHRLLERCCDASSRLIEETDGLHEVLTSAEMLASDVAADREDRRAAEGYVSPAAAAAFLKHAEQTPLEELIAATGDDPITRAYFRAVRDTPVSTEGSLVELLRSADVLPPAPRAIGTGASTPLKDAIAALSPELQAARMEELAYLANVLLSARGMRRVEAAETAVSIANLGLEHLRDPTTNAVKLFRVGWHRYARQGRAD